jgi:hypothetical protein
MRMGDEAGGIELARKAEELASQAKIVRDLDAKLSEMLLGDDVESFHLVYKPSGNPRDQQYCMCVCRDKEAVSFKHFNVYHWVQKGKVLWLSFSANREDTKFDSFELLLDYFRRGDVEAPAPIGAYVEKPANGFFDIWHYVKLISYCVLLFLGWVLSLYALVSPDWVVNDADVAFTGVSGSKGNLTVEASMPKDMTIDRIGILKMGQGGATVSVKISEAGHPAWGFCMFILTIVMLAELAALISAACLFFIDRDSVLKTSRFGNVIGNVMLFLAMIVWPAGLNNHLVPCEGYLDTKPYYVCLPWELGEGVVVQIVACIFLTIAQMVGSRIESASDRFEEEKVHIKRERERRSMWYLDVR